MSVRYFNGAPDKVLLDIRDSVVVRGVQKTTSQGHLFPAPNVRIAKLDLGGNFDMDITYLSNGKGDPIDELPTLAAVADVPTASGYSFLTKYRGYAAPFVPSSALTTFQPPDLSSSDSTLESVGASFIAQCKPDNPASDLSVALGELLKDGLPSMIGARLWKDRAITARGLADEHLNIQFGVLPLISDVRSVSSAISNSDKLLSQHIRDSGKRIRRRRTSDTVKSTEYSETASNQPIVGPTQNFMTVGFGKRVLSRVIERTQWFSGCFTYYLDPRVRDSKWANAALYAEFILGVRLDAEVLWNLAPWSWAVDWVTNAGDVISNVDSFVADGLVMPYAYVMETTKVVDTYTIGGLWVKNRPGQGFPYSTSLSVTRIIKKRRKANPFGFGITWDGLTPRQLSIAAALGLSRSSR